MVRVGKWLVVAFIAFFGSALLVFAAPRAALGAGCSSYDQTLAAIVQMGGRPFEILTARLPKVVEDAEEITGEHYAGVTRAFLLVGKETTALGLEVGGCLLDPIVIATPGPEPGA